MLLLKVDKKRTIVIIIWMTIMIMMQLVHLKIKLKITLDRLSEVVKVIIKDNSKVSDSLEKK